jgi:hypothetical protein
VRPEITALLDQADAASTHAHAILAEAGRREGEPVRHVTPGPVLQTLITSMQARGMTGQLTLCPHLSYTAPEPAAWCAWAPGRLRCPPCAAATANRIRGTREDRRCDHCRKIVPVIHQGMAQLPPVVVDLPPWPAKCVPPISMMFGLCPACQAADHAP